jgi:hypothetical protein
MSRRKALIGLACLTGFVGLLLLILGTYDTQPQHRSASEITAPTTTVPFPDFPTLDAFLTSVAPTTTTATRQATPTPIEGNIWDALAYCESGGRWDTNTGNGYGGGLQFAHSPAYSTWRAFGGLEFSPHPWEATRDQQITVAERVLASAGSYRPWPGCARKLGLL